MNEKNIKELFGFISNLFKSNPGVWITQKKIGAVCMKKYGASMGITSRVLDMVCEDNADIQVNPFTKEYRLEKGGQDEGQ